MRNKKDSNNQPDQFIDFFKEKLDKYQMPVDDKCWENIEKRMMPKPKKLSLWVVAASTAAALLIAALLLIPSKESVPQFVSGIKLSPSNNTKSDNSLKNKEVKINKTTNINNVIAHTVRKTVSVKSSGLVSEPYPIENSLSVNDTVGLTNTIIEIDKSEILADNKQDNQKTDSLATEIEKIIQKELDSEIFYTNNTYKKREKWSFMAGVSTGGNAPNNKHADNLIYSNPDKEAVYNEQLNSSIMETTNEQMEGINHLPPLTFELMLSKKLNNRIGIETGLTYTYLSSKLSSKGTLEYETKQELHYLGIPVNLVVYLWNDSKWSIYATSGGMIEKGLKQYTRQEFRNNYNNQNTNATIKKGIKGVQWSLNTSIGVSYKVYKDLGIFIEPKYTYSFDNNQPISIRTENKSVFGISGGLRFDF